MTTRYESFTGVGVALDMRGLKQMHFALLALTRMIWTDGNGAGIFFSGFVSSSVESDVGFYA